MRAAKTVIITSSNGLHARPAALFVKTAERFNCDVTVSAGKRQGQRQVDRGVDDARGRSAGTTLTIAAEGDDAEDAVETLERALAGRTSGVGHAGELAEPVPPWRSGRRRRRIKRDGLTPS